MERKLTKLEHCKVEVVVTVDEQTWKDAQDKAFKKLAANVTVDGFRKGKAPLNMVKARVDQVKVMDEAINGLLPTLYRDILDNEDVRPMAQPKVDVTKLSDKELEVKFVIVTEPQVKLGQYTGLNIKADAVEVTEDEVNAAVADVQKQNAVLSVKEGASEMGDTVVIDFVGKMDGVAFEGGSAENHELELGSHQFIPGFEEQLVGKVAGEKVEVKVTFPENYTDELKGKDATFDVTVNEVKEKKVPELNDEMVAELKIPNVENVAQLREYKQNELKTKKENEVRNGVLGKVFEEIQKTSEIEIADEMVESQTASRKQDLIKRMEQSGLTLEQYLQILGQKEEDFMKRLDEESRRDITTYFIIEEVAKQENIVIDDAQLEFEYAKIADQYKMTIEDVKKALSVQLEEFRNNIKMQRTEDFLYNQNVAK